MATITTDTFLDGGTARTAGETWTMNGGVLTIRTDTRWHANAPASMTGSIGATTTSATLGGGVLIDARNVRWLAISSGSGTAAIGDLITQGGVSGYFLGFWSSLTAAPSTTIGATGFIKLREVTGGSYTAGVLTFSGGGAATADGPDKVGWIEVVQRQAVANTVPRLGFFRTRGDWFELGETTGVAGQIVQVPTNGGGAGTHVPAIWIETSPGSGEYESYPALLAALLIPGNLSVDARSKFVQTMGNGQVRIGNNGTNNVGYLPASGCKIRIPNILGRQSASGTDAVNQVPNATLTTRPDFTTTSAGDIDFEYFMNDWYHLFSSPYKVKMVNCATFDIHSTNNEASPTDLNNYVVSPYTAGVAIALTLLSNPLGGTIQNSKFFRGDAASNGHACTITTSADYTLTNCHFGIITYARSTGRSISTSQCLNLTFNDIYQYNSYTQHTTSFNITHTGLDHCDRFVGNTNATTGMYCVTVNTSSDNIMVDGLTFGLKGVITDFCNPYLSPFYSINSSNITFRNAGTRTTPLRVASATLGPQYLVHDAGVNTNLTAQRIYTDFTRTSPFISLNTSKNIKLESVHGTVGSWQTLSLNTLIKGVRATDNSVTGGASVYGTHFFDMFTSNTAGRLWWAMNEPTSFSQDYVTLTLAGSVGGFTSGGQVSMPTVGDELIIETPYYVLGHDSFQNAAATLTGTLTGNFTYEYSIDINDGNGFGAYKTLDGTNLSSELISPSDGFKMRLKITTVTANSTNALTYIRILSNTSIASQTNNLYPLDTVDINLVGYSAGTRVYVYDTTNNVEIYNDVPPSSALTISAVYTTDFNVNIRAMYASGNIATLFTEFNDTVTSAGLSRTIIQENDTVYFNNNITGSSITDIVIDDSNLLVNIDSGLLSWGYIYAYETYWLSTEQGIRDEARFIEALDEANYLFTDFKIKNVTSPTVPLVITNGWGRDSITNETIDIIDTSGGSIFSNPDLVIAYETSGGGGGGATAADIWSYSTRTLSTGGVTAVQSGLAKYDDLVIINGGVQKASKLIPYNGTL